MTNEQKYKTTEERIKAFDEFCKGQGDRCNHCEIAKKQLSINRRSQCVVYWLALEAEEEKPEPASPNICDKANLVIREFEKVATRRPNGLAIIDCECSRLECAVEELKEALREASWEEE